MSANSQGSCTVSDASGSMNIAHLPAVNPQAINESKPGLLLGLLISDLNVYTLNKRSVMVINANLGAGRESVPIGFVAVGGQSIGYMSKRSTG